MEVLLRLRVVQIWWCKRGGQNNDHNGFVLLRWQNNN